MRIHVRKIILQERARQVIIGWQYSSLSKNVNCLESLCKLHVKRGKDRHTQNQTQVTVRVHRGCQDIPLNVDILHGSKWGKLVISKQNLPMSTDKTTAKHVLRDGETEA